MDRNWITLDRPEIKKRLVGKIDKDWIRLSREGADNPEPTQPVPSLVLRRAPFISGDTVIDLGKSAVAKRQAAAKAKSSNNGEGRRDAIPRKAAANGTNVKPRVSILHGDCLAILPTIEAASVDAVITDTPYNLTSIQSRFRNPESPPVGLYYRTGKGFMNKAWDSDIAFHPEVWRECLRVLRPGGHLLAFGGPRTFHRLFCAVEDAGFELRDTIMWLHGQGFPKAHDISKAIDKKLGYQPEAIGSYTVPVITGNHFDSTRGSHVIDITVPGSSEGKEWQGWSSALKPAFEPILVARKPMIGSMAANVLLHGVGGLNIDGCREGRGLASIVGRTQILSQRVYVWVSLRQQSATRATSQGALACQHPS